MLKLHPSPVFTSPSGLHMHSVRIVLIINTCRSLQFELRDVYLKAQSSFLFSFVFERGDEEFWV